MRPLLLLPCIALALPAQAPLQVAGAWPQTLDLSGEAAADWVPRDARDPAQVEAAARAWALRVGPLRSAGAVRILLPAGPDRLPLLLAASQALKAQDPAQALYIAFTPGAAPVLDESAWGAVEGGALLPQDLGADPGLWRERLMEAQNQFPGRPWTLWLPGDPGPRLSELLGDGGRLVVPPGGPAARLVAQLPGDFPEVEGGTGDLTLRRRSGEALRWRFQGEEWQPAPPPAERHAVSVSAAAAYDVGALLARVRAAQLADRAAAHNREGRLEVDLHLQAAQGPGTDLGFSFRFFEAAGEPEEDLQQAIRINGVKARLHPGLQLPIVESRASLAVPAALNLTERYRYRDGGPGAAPGQRRIRFEPVDGDPLLPSGELLVDESSGRVLEQRSERAGMPGTVKSERTVLTYGEAGAGTWRVVRAQSFERWLLAGAVVPVQRTLVYSDFVTNAPDFEASRGKARQSDATMVRQTLDGTRYFNKRQDGTRQVEERVKSSGRAVGGVLLVDPTLAFPVLPLAGLAYFDFNAFNRGVQINLLTAVLFNQVQVTVPRVLGWDFSASSSSLLLAATERPIVNGRLQDDQGVGRRFVTLNLGLGHDLGAGLRFDGSVRLQEDLFSQPLQTQYRTPGFTLPPSGLTRELRGELSWQHAGFQLAGYLGRGLRPEGIYGPPEELQAVPDQGRFQRWGARAGYDHKLGGGAWLHGETGWAGGQGFDRFKSLSIGGVGGDVRIAGIRSNALTADRLAYAKGGVVLPSGPGLRLTFSLDHARVRSLDDQRTRTFTGLGAAGDLPGFWVFTSVRLDLGMGLLSSMPGVRTVNGFVGLFRVF